MAGQFRLVYHDKRDTVIAVVTEDYFLQLPEVVPAFYKDLRYEPYSSDLKFKALNDLLPFRNINGVLEKAPAEQLNEYEGKVLRLHKLLIQHYEQETLAPKPWWTYLGYYNEHHFKLTELLLDFCLQEGVNLLENFVDFALVRYQPRFFSLLERYFEDCPPVNNQNPKALRLAEYDGIKGDLFLLVDGNFRIRGLTSVVVSEEAKGPAAKIYGRLHIQKGCSHTTIDRFFEPALFHWCEIHNHSHIFLTINEGRHRILEWTVRRIGERRHLFRENAYTPEIGSRFRSGLIPYKKMILERNVWQYILFYSPDGEFFLERQTKELDVTAERILRREYSRATQNWS